MRLNEVKESDDVIFCRTFVGGHLEKGEGEDNSVPVILYYSCSITQHNVSDQAYPTPTPRSGDEHTNHEACVPPRRVAQKKLAVSFYKREICCLLGGFLVKGSP